MLDLEGHVVVLMLVLAEDLQGAVDAGEEAVERRHLYLQKILMLIWRSTIQNQCKLIKSSPMLVELSQTPAVISTEYCLYFMNTPNSLG